MGPKRIILKSASGSSGSSSRGQKTGLSSGEEGIPIDDDLQVDESLESDDEDISIEDEPSEDDDIMMEEADLAHYNISMPSTRKINTKVIQNRLTSRQLALTQPTPQESEITPLLPTSKRSMSEEDQLRRSEKTRRRNNQRDIKLEKARVDTIQRILQKQSARSKKMDENSALESESISKSKWSNQPPMTGDFRIVSNNNGIHLIVLENFPLPNLAVSLNFEKPVEEKCSAIGCSNPRASLHPTKMLPICPRLKCYQSLSQG